jgi:hypothetical protein
MTSPSNEEDVVSVKNPASLLTMYMEFMRLRSQYVVGKALAEKFASEAELEDGLTSTEFVHTVDKFAGLIFELRSELETVPDGSIDAEKVINEYFPQSLTAIHDFAEYLGVSGEDILSVMIHTKV